MPGGRTRKADVRNSGIQCSAQDVPMSGGTVRPPTRAGTVLLIPVAQNPRSRRETLVSRPARALPEQVPRGDPRAVREIKNERFQLHKPPVSTYPFPLATAFSQSSASDEKSDLPRPDLPPVGAVFFSHTGRTPFSRPRGRQNNEIPRNSKRAPAVKLSSPDPRGRCPNKFRGAIRARCAK